MPASELITSFVVEGTSQLLGSLKRAAKSQMDYVSGAKSAAKIMEVYNNKQTQSMAELEKVLIKTSRAAKELARQHAISSTGLSQAGGKVGKFTVGIGNLARAMKTKLMPAMKGVGKLAKGGLVVGFGAAAAAASAAAAGILVGLKGIYSGLKRGWEAAKQYQKTFAIMETTFESMNTSANAMSLDGAVEEMERLYEATLFTKEEILRAQAAIGRTTTDPEIFKKATQAALDLAAAKPEMNAVSASQFITTLLGDPSRTMDKFRRAEIQVSAGFQEAMARLVKAGRMQEAQLLTLEQLSGRFAGAAEAAADTAAGSIQGLTREVEDIYREAAEIFGEEIADPFKELTDYVKDNRDEIINTFKAVAQYAGDMADSGAKFAKSIGPILPMINSALDSMNAGSDKPASEDSMLKDANSAVWGTMITPLTHVMKGVNALTGQYEAVAVEAKILAGEEAASARKLQEMKRKAHAEEQEAAKQRVLGIETWEEKMVRIEEQQKKAAEIRKRNQDEYVRSLKRVQVYFRDTETAQERYRGQVAKIQDLWMRALQTGHANAALHKQLSELQRRLYGELREELDKPRKEAEKEREAKAKASRDELEQIMKQNDPMTPFFELKEQFERVMRDVAPGARRTAVLQNLQNQMAELGDRGIDESRAFSPVVTSIDGLYNTIRSSVLTKKDDPTTKAINQVNETLITISEKESKEWQRRIDAQKPIVK